MCPFLVQVVIELALETFLGNRESFNSVLESPLPYASQLEINVIRICLYNFLVCLPHNPVSGKTIFFRNPITPITSIGILTDYPSDTLFSLSLGPD